MQWSSCGLIILGSAFALAWYSANAPAQKIALGLIANSIWIGALILANIALKGV